jgi:hypothetical protein
VSSTLHRCHSSRHLCQIASQFEGLLPLYIQAVCQLLCPTLQPVLRYNYLCVQCLHVCLNRTDGRGDKSVHLSVGSGSSLVHCRQDRAHKLAQPNGSAIVDLMLHIFCSERGRGHHMMRKSAREHIRNRGRTSRNSSSRGGGSTSANNALDLPRR